MPKKKTLASNTKRYVKMLTSPEYREALDRMAHAAKDASVSEMIHRLVAKEAKRLKIDLPPR